MINKITLLITLLSFSVIVSQPFMYLLAFKQTSVGLSAGSYIEMRKLIDAAMRSNFKYVLYTALLSNLALIIINIKNPGGVVFITAAIALVCLLADVMLTLKGNLPINDIINSWSVNHYPANWAAYRDKWLLIFKYREIAGITAFVSLLIGAVFGNK